MIIVNCFFNEDYNSRHDGYNLDLQGIINDHFDLNADIDLIKDAIENDPDFWAQKKLGVLYEIQLIRATISADPVPENAFAIDRVIEKKFDEDHGWVTPLVRM